MEIKDFDSWIILGIAALNAYTAYVTRRTSQTTTDTHEIALKTEKNTNSMKDALVKATGEAAHAAGKEEGRIEGDAKAAVLAQGKLDGQS